MQRIRNLAALTLLALAFPSHAQQSPLGLWKTIDDKTGKPKALVRITEQDGILSGKIERLYREPAEDQNPLCVECPGDLKDKPIIGMQILSGLKKEEDGSRYVGGAILDPNNGKTYRARAELVESGKKLEVRGYIGLPALGRTQTWVREGG